MGGTLSSSRVQSGENMQHLEDTVRRQKEHVSILEAALENEHAITAQHQRMGQTAAVIGVCAAALLGVALPLVMRGRVSAATTALERTLSTSHAAALADVRRRAALDLQNREKFAIDAFSRDLLQVADNLEYVQKHVQPENVTDSSGSNAPGRLEALVEGVALTKQSLLDVFQKHGVEKQAPLGQRFDPNMHEAVLRVNSPSSDYQPGMVAEVLRSGFTIHERVLRAAQVAVTVAPEGTGSVTGSNSASTPSAEVGNGGDAARA